MAFASSSNCDLERSTLISAIEARLYLPHECLWSMVNTGTVLLLVQHVIQVNSRATVEQWIGVHVFEAWIECGMERIEDGGGSVAIDSGRLHGIDLLCSWLREKQFIIQNNYLYVLTDPVRRKFHSDSTVDRKKFHTRQKRPKVFD